MIADLEDIADADDGDLDAACRVPLRLTAAAQAFGNVDLYPDDDGRLYL